MKTTQVQQVKHGQTVIVTQENKRYNLYVTHIRKDDNGTFTLAGNPYMLIGLKADSLVEVVSGDKKAQEYYEKILAKCATKKGA